MFVPLMQLFHGEIVMADPKTCAVWIGALWNRVTVSVGDVHFGASVDPAVIFRLLS